VGERGIREGFALPETHPPKARGLWKPGVDGSCHCLSFGDMKLGNLIERATHSKSLAADADPSAPPG
jgi:hypothetical protein